MTSPMAPGTYIIDTACDTLTGPNTAWVGKYQDPGDLPKAIRKVRAATAAALGVPIEEVTVAEHPRPAGVLLVASWWPQ